MACVVGLIPRHALAQKMPSLRDALGSDSVAWERVGLYLVESLSAHMMRTGGDSSLQPWKITAPTDAPLAQGIVTKLRTILRARPIEPSDSVAYEIDIGRLIIANDTARVTIRTDFRKMCPGSARLGGYGNVDRVVVVRHSRGFWGQARSEGVLHGDRFGC